MIAGRRPWPGRHARAASPAGSSQSFARGDAEAPAIGSRKERGSPCGGMIARRAELAGADAVADDGGAELEAAVGTTSDAVGEAGASIEAGARAVAASAAERAAAAPRLGRASPRPAGAASSVASAPERAAIASADEGAGFAPSARPERGRVDPAFRSPPAARAAVEPAAGAEGRG
jgi:hypothetical protein